MKRFLCLFGSAIALFAGGSGFLALYPPVPRDLGGARDLDDRAEAVRIPVGAGDHLRGWYVPGTNGACVLVLHGYGRDHTRAWRYGSFLQEAGYGVLAIDFRSSRLADRLPTTLGYYELQDARAAVGWLRGHCGSNERVGVLGESLGGSVALALAAGDTTLRAVVADCPFATGARALADASERWLHLPGAPVSMLARGLGRVATGHDPGGLDVLTAAGELRGRPVFFIHARDDDRIAVGECELLWRAAGEKDPIWLVEGGHNQAWLRERAPYEARVLAFFDHALRDRGPGVPPGRLADALAARAR